MHRKKDPGEGKGHECQDDEKNPAVFTPAARIMDALPYRGTDTHILPLIPVTPSLFLMSFVL